VLSGFRFAHPVELRFRDMDALGHVNNVVFLTYMESARMAWWMKVTGRDDLADLRMILARTEVDYRSPATFGDRLVVGVRCASLRRASFVLEFRIEELRTGRLVAEARKVLVHYDYAARRSTPVPAELRRQILAQDPEARELSAERG
jgi:acyl-CoA thioester hydrolase